MKLIAIIHCYVRLLRRLYRSNKEPSLPLAVQPRAVHSAHFHRFTLHQRKKDLVQLSPSGVFSGFSRHTYLCVWGSLKTSCVYKRVLMLKATLLVVCTAHKTTHNAQNAQHTASHITKHQTSFSHEGLRLHVENACSVPRL